MGLNYENTNYWNGLSWDEDFPTGTTNYMDIHIKDKVIHVTQADKDRWNNTQGVTFKIVDELPQTGVDGTIYLVRSASGETGNLYNEFIYIDNKWEEIGRINVDISGKQDKLISGTNIKTVNGTDLLGEGNVNIVTYNPFPTGWTTGGTLEQVVSSMLQDKTYAVQGMAYLGQLKGSCLPTSELEQAECKVEFMTNDVAVLSINSADIEPYSWQYNTYCRSIGDYTWRKSVYQGTNADGEYLKLGNTTLTEQQLIALKNLLN